MFGELSFSMNITAKSPTLDVPGIVGVHPVAAVVTCVNANPVRVIATS
jgi:hypothetical protein